jgi:hypothetical protein
MEKVCPIMTRGVLAHHYGDPVVLSSPIICLKEGCQLWVLELQELDPVGKMKGWQDLSHCGLIKE